MWLFHLHAFLAVVGALVGIFMLKLLDEGIWDASLLRGAMLPNPSPQERLIFVMLCALLPEIAIAGFLCLFLFAKGGDT